MQLERGRFDEYSLFKATSLTQDSLGLVLDRINNAFVERLNVRFIRHDDDPRYDSGGARFLGHLHENAGALECRIKTLCNVGLIHSRAHIDYALVDFVANHLKPQALDTIVCCNEQQTSQTMLFDHVSMRSSIKHVLFQVSKIRWV